MASISEAASWADVIVLATPWSGARQAIEAAGELLGKVLIDATNPISADFSGLALGHDTSAGEQIAGWAAGAHVVKAFNTIGYNIMENPDFGGMPATLLIAGDDLNAKATVAALATDIGFDARDAGPIVQARYMEAFAWLWISMAIKYGQGREMAFHLMKR